MTNSIRHYRIKAKLSQSELARLIGRTQQEVSKWEKGLYTPAARTMVKIADVLKTPVDLLLGDAVVSVDQ